MVGLDHGVEEADAYADAALARLRQAGVPTTPDNFEIFYAYVAQANRELVRAIDVLISNNQPFTPERLDEIHRLYFTAKDCPGATLAELSDRVEATLRDAAAELGQVADSTHAFGGRLADLHAQAAPHADHAGDSADTRAAALPQLVEKLIAETRAMAGHARSVSANLSQQRQQVESLQSSLDEMRAAAETDQLTGLPNRRVLERTLRTEAAQAMEVGSEVCVAMVDIDHFKAFNDTHGHLMGDQVLKLVAKVMRSELREADTVARWGGEEFALLLPATDLATGFEVCERVRTHLAGRRLTNRQTGQTVGRVTVSMGLAAYAYGEPLDTLLKRADTSLYAAKSAGRNRVTTEAEETAGLVGFNVALPQG
jgi:diguanylate cyclase